VGDEEAVDRAVEDDDFDVWIGFDCRDDRFELGNVRGAKNVERGRVESYAPVRIGMAGEVDFPRVGLAAHVDLFYVCVFLENNRAAHVGCGQGHVS
jgi:hypothetical protein